MTPDQPAVNPAAFVAQARRQLTPNPQTKEK